MSPFSQPHRPPLHVGNSKTSEQRIPPASVLDPKTQY